MSDAPGAISHADVMELATNYAKLLCDVYVGITTARVKAAADAETAMEVGIQAYAEGWAADLEAELAKRDARIAELVAAALEGTDG